MASIFPAGADNLATNLSDSTASPTTHPAHHDDLASAVNAVQTALLAGTAPPSLTAIPESRVTGLTADLALKAPLAAPTFSGAVSLSDSVSRLVPGSTSISLRNTANSADNLIITDAGAVTVRAGITITSGQVLASDGAVATPGLSFASFPAVGFQVLSANGCYYNVASANRMFFGSATLQLQSTYSFGWTGGVPGNALDTVLLRDAANTLAQRNGTTPQLQNLYATWTSATVYERLATKAVAASDFVIVPEVGGGGGTLRGLSLGSASGRLGFFAKTAVVQQSTATVASDLATAITLVNALKTALTNLGLTN